MPNDTGLAEAIRDKLNEPAFQALDQNLPQINSPRYLQAQKVRLTGVDRVIVQLASGAEVIISEADWNAAAPDSR